MRDIALLIFEGDGTVPATAGKEYIVFVDPADMHRDDEYQPPGTGLTEALILSAHTPPTIPSSVPIGFMFEHVL